ncbi:MAG: HupE/UreJ family protein, partial [Pseudomonadota bacterium]
GWLHPLTGPDHMLAMLAVGAWSAKLGGAAIYKVPSAFVCAMVAGGIAALNHWPLPGAEIIIAASVLTLGLAIAMDRRLALPLAAVATALFGLAHGSAHGSEFPQTADAVSYVVGFLVTTAGLHVAGVVAGLLLLERQKGRTWLRTAGAAAALAGCILLGAVAGSRISL